MKGNNQAYRLWRCLLGCIILLPLEMHAQVKGDTITGKVHAIEAMKLVKATNENATVFDATELDIIQAGLTRLYGKPQYGLNENNAKYNRVGAQWISKSKEANCFIDFYGTFVGYKLQFSLCEHSEDF